MGKEIERKFLVKSQSFVHEAFCRTQVDQGYLSLHVDRTVRVRRTKNDSTGVVSYDLTVKGRTTDDGLERAEWEIFGIDAQVGAGMLKMCVGVIRKVRYLVIVPVEDSTIANRIEVDVFLDINDGLVVAEIELLTKDTEFARPYWLGEEVTGDPKYYNASLIGHPYQNWSDDEKRIEVRGCGNCSCCTCRVQ